MSQGSRTRLLTAGILIAVFGTGVLVGLVVDSELRATPSPEGTEAPASPEATVAAEETEGEEAVEEETRRRPYIYEKVEPDETQLALIDSIVTEHRAKRRALDEEFETRHEVESRAILLETRNAIKAVLSPEQAAEYQRLLDEWDEEQAREEAARESGEQRD